MGKVTLSDALKDLREQLEKAQTEGTGRMVRFVAETVEIEMGLVLKETQTAEGTIFTWFLNLGGSKKSEDEISHTAKIVLKPVDSKGRTTLIASPELEHDGERGSKPDRASERARVRPKNPDLEQ